MESTTTTTAISRNKSTYPSFSESVIPPTIGEEQLTRPVETLVATPPDRCVVVEAGGVRAGCPHAVQGDEVTLGRGRTCTVQLEDAKLSRVHARMIRLGPAEYVIEDAGSLNGTFVNERRVSRTPLRDGDRIRLGGHTWLRFHTVSEEEEKAFFRVYEGSVRDGLTGLFNRRHLQERLLADVSYSMRHGTELSLLLFDLDHFKAVNDRRGHLAGDAVLRSVAQTIARAVRAEDLVARYGGEELVVVARGIPLAGGRNLAERLRRAIAQDEIPFAGGPIRVTTSVGVASVACCGAERSVERLLTRADERLYRAKAEGRNRVIAD